MDFFQAQQKITRPYLFPWDFFHLSWSVKEPCFRKQQPVNIASALLQSFFVASEKQPEFLAIESHSTDTDAHVESLAKSKEQNKQLWAKQKVVVENDCC